jgi:hypothetical protein
LITQVLQGFLAFLAFLAGGFAIRKELMRAMVSRPLNRDIGLMRVIVLRFNPKLNKKYRYEKW